MVKQTKKIIKKIKKKIKENNEIKKIILNLFMN